MKNLARSVFLFSLGFVAALELLRSHRHELVVIESYESEPRDSRTPAAIRRVYDYSHLVGNALQTAVQNHLVGESRIVQGSEGPGVQLVHFVVKNKTGEKSFACDEYDTLELTFYADGVLESGSSPVMIAETPCRFTQDVNLIDPVWIPVKQLVADRPGNMDLSLNTMPQPLRLQFKDMPPFWPGKWVLTSIRMFKKDNPVVSLRIESDQIRRLSPRPLTVYFAGTEKK